VTGLAVPVVEVELDRQSAEAGTYRTLHRRHLHARGSTTAQRPQPPLPPSTDKHWQWPLYRAVCRWRARWPRPLAVPWPQKLGPCTQHTATPWRSSVVYPSSAGFETTPEIINQEYALTSGR